MAVEDHQYPSGMPSEAKRIRSFIEERWKSLGGDLDRHWQSVATGYASTYEALREDHHDRYPFELLQNAHDACADQEDRSGKISFVWSDEALHVADNGKGFFDPSRSIV